MKRITLLPILLLMLCTKSFAQQFDAFFTEKSLRLDYMFTGDASRQEISLDKLSAWDGWAGRKHRLGDLPLLGNGQVEVTDEATGQVIYRTSFSSLFSEWLVTDEAKTTRKSFEATFLVPFPQKPVIVRTSLINNRHEVMTAITHRVDPTDVLIHRMGQRITPHRYLLKSGAADRCVDIAICAEGYTETEMDRFYEDAQVACDALFDHEPFKSMKERFNVVAVASPSLDSGVSVPRLEEWKQTAFGSHFSTFYSDRYLTTLNVKSIRDALAGIDYEHIIILANTDEYGGGGIYNSYTLTTAHHPMFRPVVVHEFGHSFGGLGDEYFYDDDVMTDTYPLDIEPWEQNITTQVDFDSKWKDMLQKGTPNPTPVNQKEKYAVGIYEGGGYSAKGIYRPAFNCRMRTNENPEFCPVCQRALSRLILFYTE